VWSDDRVSFDRAWTWTQRHLIDSDGLLQWLWSDGEVLDPNSATDADVDTALALLLGGQRWNDPELIDQGRQMVRAIWQYEVTTVDGVPYITAGDWATDGPVVALNPSYFSPYAYRIFSEVDPEHDWQAVIDSGYQVLFDASQATLHSGRSAGLPPDWVGLERATGEIVALELDEQETTHYGYDAARVYWRVALDLQWFNDGRAESYLNLAGFLRDEVARKGRVSAVYAHDGTIIQQPSSLVGTAGALAALLTLDPDAADALYTGQIIGTANRNDTGAYWGEPDNLYGQEWAWFATALYTNAVPNLWHTPPGR
jgi:endoglucanase